MPRKKKMRIFKPSMTMQELSLNFCKKSFKPGSNEEPSLDRIGSF